MRIIGHGIDLVETRRIADMLERHGDRFLERCFTQGERRYAAANRARQVEHLAGRFAAKEAAFKALGTGLSGGIKWTDVQVVRARIEGAEVGPVTGAPRIELTGVASRIAHELGIVQWHVSITHVRDCAMASVLAVGD